jgi:adenosine deaminase
MTGPGDPRLAELIRALPKSDLHVHLDGSLRLSTLIELARAESTELPSYTEEGLLELAFKPTYQDLGEYLEGFKHTCAVLQSEEALERVAYELAEDCQNEGVCYLEVRFAPQLHVHRNLSLAQVVRAVARGLDRAERAYNARAEVKRGEVPPFHAAIILCALRFFLPQFSKGYQAYFDSSGYSPPEEVFKRASLDLARAAAHFKNEEGLPVTGFDLAGREKGYPAEAHEQAYQIAHEAFLGKTVHAGEDFGPESIFQAIGDLHADRIGHGTWLLNPARVTDLDIADPKDYVDRLAQYVADHRITLEVCLTSNQQTVPELAGDLSRHPFGQMVQERLSTALCTDNRLVSRTNMSREVQLAAETFGLSVKELRDILTYGFKRSFFPGQYLQKRNYVRSVLDVMNRVIADWKARHPDHPLAG